MTIGVREGLQEAGHQLERSKTLAATVAERLRAGIMDGSIPLGSLLSEKSLAERFGVSKSPVREALVELQTIGLVTILPQRGGLVFRPDPDQVRELSEVRLELETAALTFAIERNGQALTEDLSRIVAAMDIAFDEREPTQYQLLDDEFHTTFFAHCKNSLLANTYQGFTPRIGALRRHLSAPQPYLLKRSLEDHRMMVDLVRAGDKANAIHLLHEHISRTQDFHLRALAEGETKPSQKAKRPPPAPHNKNLRAPKKKKRS